MRIAFALPLFAAAALAACSGSADEELADEALSADEVAGAASVEADFTLPGAGQYRTTQELIDFSLASLPAEQMATIRQQFAAGAAQPHSYCVSATMTREQWLSQMAESNCTIARNNGSGGNVDLVLTCNAVEGISGRVALTGTATATGSDMEMTFTQAIPGAGDGTIKLRVKSERTGDCA